MTYLFDSTCLQTALRSIFVFSKSSTVGSITTVLIDQCQTVAVSSGSTCRHKHKNLTNSNLYKNIIWKPQILSQVLSYRLYQPQSDPKFERHFSQLQKIITLCIPTLNLFNLNSLYTNKSISVRLSVYHSHYQQWQVLFRL